MLCDPALLLGDPDGRQLLPASRSPHRSPDLSSRPWTPRLSGTRCGPEVGQTANDRAARHCDTEGEGGATTSATACDGRWDHVGMKGQAGWMFRRHKQTHFHKKWIKKKKERWSDGWDGRVWPRRWWRTDHIWHEMKKKTKTSFHKKARFNVFGGLFQEENFF